jgi:MSHA pilin protein MshC
MKLQSKGFTLLELIIILIVTSILSAYVLMRAPSSSLYTQSSAAEQVRRDIRYTQSLAMSLNASYSINFSANGYTITPPPPNGAYSITMPTGVTLSVVTITFDATGTPGAAASVTVTGSGGTTTLTVAAETGFVNG